MIRFPYQSFPLKGTRGAGYEIVHRPMIPIRVMGLTGDDDLRALVDTGADDILLPASLIDALGVSFRPGD